MSDSSLHVVLVNPEIHWNTGNVGRTCLAVGARLHLIEPLGFSLDDRRVRRAGLDYWPRVEPTVWPDWPTFEARLAELGEPFLLCTGAATPYTRAAFPSRTVLVFGCESTGLPESLRQRHADHQLAIPMRDPVLRSLNLSTAVAVVAYEVLRQWASGERWGGPL